LPVGSRRRRIFRAIDEGAGDGDALLFRRRKSSVGRWPRRCVRRNRSRPRGRGAGRSPAIDFGEAKRKFDVFFDVMRGKKVLNDLKKRSCRWCCAVARELERVERCDVLGRARNRSGGGASSPAMRSATWICRSRKSPRRAGNSLLAQKSESSLDGADGSFAHGVVAGDAVELDAGSVGGMEVASIDDTREREKHFI